MKLPESERNCPICGKKYRKIEIFQRVSYEIEIRIEVYLKKHMQEVYEKECDCDKKVPDLIVAKKPESIIYKSLYSTNTWCQLLAMKYLTGIPVHRFNGLINNPDYRLNPSTVLGGFERILEKMMPLYEAILSYNQAESHWHADETRWCKMTDSEGKNQHLYWMWVFVGKKSVVYVMDPTRSKSVPQKHFENTKAGILNVDRLASYNIVGDKLIIAYCWYHLRRDIINVGKKDEKLVQWTIEWLQKIRTIEKLNRKRFEKYTQQLPYEDIQNELCMKIQDYFNEAETAINSGDLKTIQLKVLKNMLKRKSGYTVFVDYPWVPLHNNVAEREFRHIAYARNNYGGSKSVWGGSLAAVTWTIFKTAKSNGLKPVEYLTSYFESYISSDGFRQGIPTELLPWNYKNLSSNVSG